jgi:YHS domain-containing protein
VGESANVVVTKSFRDGVTYLVDRGIVRLPWGEEVAAALAVPVDQLAIERQKTAAGRVLTKVTDPVCRMMIYPEDAVATIEHEGTTYHFCAQSCRDRFEVDPERYLAAR